MLNRTYFKTVNGVFLALNTTFVNAFSDTVVLCPGTTPCTIAVTVSSQFGSVTAGQVARARVFVNGLLTHPGDACCLNMSPNASGRPQTATMTFVREGHPRWQQDSAGAVLGQRRCRVCRLPVARDWRLQTVTNAASVQRGSFRDADRRAHPPCPPCRPDAYDHLSSHFVGTSRFSSSPQCCTTMRPGAVAAGSVAAPLTSR